MSRDSQSSSVRAGAKGLLKLPKPSLSKSALCRCAARRQHSILASRLPASVSIFGAQVDAQLYKQYLAEYPVAGVVRAARNLQAPNSPAGLQLMADCEPDLIVSIRYRRILRDAAIAIPRHGILNLHSGMLPDYRGVMATFWAMLNDEPEIGATLHRIVDSGIDTGPVIGISRVQTQPRESYLANVLGLYIDGCSLLANTVDAMIRGEFRCVVPPPTGSGRYYSTPDEAAIKAFTAQNLCMASGEELGLAHRPG